MNDKTLKKLKLLSTHASIGDWDQVEALIESEWCGRQYAKRCLKTIGIDLPRKSHVNKSTDEKLKRLILLVNAEVWDAVDEMIEKEWCSRGYAKDQLLECGITLPRKRSKLSKRCIKSERTFKVIGALVNKPELSMAAIARIYNVSRQYVEQIKVAATKYDIL